MAYRANSGTQSYGSYTTEDANLADRGFNDGRLEKAIQYLRTEGSGDAIDLFLTRVNTIDEHILQQFPAQGRSFDPRLYRRLRDLVREVQDVQFVNNDESPLDSDGDSSIEVLYKSAEDDSDSELYPRSLNVPAVARSSTPRSIIKTKKTLDLGAPDKNKEEVRFESDTSAAGEDDVREKCFLYGGPNNDPEVWYKKSAPLLPIGESPYAERWESMKINRDLAKARTQSLDEPKGMQGFTRANMYDSGSRYKLPTGVTSEWSQNKDRYAKIRRLWIAADGWFNTGRRLGPSKGRRKGQNYAPRMALPPVCDIDVKPFVMSTPHTNEKQYSEMPAGKIAGGQILTPPHSSPLSPQRVPRLPETNLKKFNSTREAATRRDKSSPLDSSKMRAALATTPTPETRLQPGPTTGTKIGRRKPGRPPNKPQDPSPTPPRRPRLNSDTSPLEEEFDELFDKSPEQQRARLARKPKDPSYRPPRRVSQDEDSPITPSHTMIDEEIEELLGRESSKPKRARLANKPKDPSYHPPRRVSQDADSPTSPDRSTLIAEINELTGSGPSKPPRVRYHETSNDPNWKPEQSPLTPTKRMRDETLNLTPPSKKSRSSTASSKKQSPSSSLRVGFAGETSTPAMPAVPSRKATPTKSAFKKITRVSAEDRELASTETLERRGKTRSKRNFKPARLQSRDETKW